MKLIVLDSMIESCIGSALTLPGVASGSILNTEQKGWLGRAQLVPLQAP